MSAQMRAGLENSRNNKSLLLPPQTPPDARNSSHSHIGFIHLAHSARICINVSPYDRRRCDMQNRNPISPPALKHI